MAEFITLTDENDRQSSLMLGKDLVVVGVLLHGTKIRPLDTANAQKLVEWLIKEFPDIPIRR